MTQYKDFSKIPYLRYKIIFADPPWPWKTYSDKGQERSPSRHYDTMTVKEICDITVCDVAAPDSVLFLWCTAPLVAKGVHVEVIESWGFECKAIAFVWVKLNRKWEGPLIADKDFFMNMGKYTAQNAEFVFVGTKGSPGMPLEKMLPQIIATARREHSRKPDEALDRAERMYGGPRLEMFARKPRKGWDSFGNQIEKFIGDDNVSSRS